MRKLILAIGLLLICCSLSAGGRKESHFKSREIDQIQDVERKGKINIDNVAGSVTISTWDRDQVKVKGKIGEDVEEVTFKTRGKTTTIKVELPKQIWDWNVNSEAFLEITIPAASDLNITTVSAEIEIEGVNAEIEASSVSGAISVSDIEADYLTLKTVSGSINVKGNSKTLEANTVSGAITYKGTCDELRCTSVSGSLSYKDGNADIVYMKTTSGQIYVNCDVEDKARVDLNSLSGNVTLKIPSATDARFSLKSFSGRLDYKDFLGESGAETDDIGSNGNNKISFVLGSGKGRISAESFSGSVVLEAN